MSEKIVIVDDGTVPYSLKRKRIQDIEGYAAPTDAQTQAAVDAWMDEHSSSYIVPDNSLTQAKLVKGTLGYVTPEMFGAVGDGVTNDYQAFADCAAYANQNKLRIKVPQKTYFINGSATIELLCNVECDNSVFIVGDNHFKTARPVFRYAHDLETQETNILLSGVFADNDTVTSAFADKFFLLDTKIAYGTPNSQTAPSNETVKEMIFTNGTKTHVWFDNVADHLNDTVDATHISDMGEIGYRFSGAVIRQKTENSYGITFLKIERNNMTVENIQIECMNELAQNNVIGAEFCNAVTFRNIKSYTIQPNIWGYEIALYYSANVIMDNVKGYNEWSTIATRGLKNYTLLNSITNTFDCHWNAYGMFICENCVLYGDAHIGYGKGEYIVRNTKCNSISLRRDFVQIWCGTIVLEDVISDGGFIMNLSDDTASGYDSFFDAIELPEIRITRLKSFGREFYFRIPNDTAERINTGSKIILDSMTLKTVDVPYTNKVYDLIIKSTPESNARANFKKLCNVLYDDNVPLVDELSTSKFTSIESDVRKTGDIVTIRFSGVLNSAQTASAALATIPDGFRPPKNVYFPAIYSTASAVNVYALKAQPNGNIVVLQAIENASRRLSFSISYTLDHGY